MEVEHMRSPFILLGVPVDAYSFSQTVDRLESMVESGRATGKTYQAATINTDFIVNSLQDKNLMQILQEVEAATADGMPIVWAARSLGIPVQERVAGADLVPALAERAAKRGFSIYFYGAGTGVAQRAAYVLQQRYPGLRIAGCYSPPFAPVDQTDPAVLENIRAARPDILFVALGNPKQERWIHLYRRQLGVPLMMGVGGSLDFIAGERKRAPRWTHSVGLEWLFRLLQEPQRLAKRYLVDMVVFSKAFLRQWLILPKSTKHRSLGAFEWRQVGNFALIHATGDVNHQNLNELQSVMEQALSGSTHIVVNLEGLRSLDSAALGLLFQCSSAARGRGGQVTLVKAPKKVRSSLALLQLESYFRFADSLPVSAGALPAAKDYPAAV